MSRQSILEGATLRPKRRPAERPAKFALAQRRAGVLLHPTSLAGGGACGQLGAAAREFVDFLADAGQGWWQILPLGPLGPGNSPYSTTSAFAGNPLLIDAGELVANGLISRAELPQPRRGSARARFADAARDSERLLRRAFEAAGGARSPQYGEFAAREAVWLGDFALFSAIRAVHGCRPWLKWPAPLRDAQPAAIERFRAEHAREIAYHEFVQFLFDRQWRALCSYAHERGVGLLGDIPIFVVHDSADVWAQRELFELDAYGRPKVVSGCPPDSFSATGQLWGHPHYRWSTHAESGFAWWTARFAAALRQCDAVRIDHFIGFHRAWHVPGRARTALHGRYVAAPGRALLEAVTRQLGRMEVVAEDLGAVTPEVRALAAEFGFPGMRILQNGFGEQARYDQPHNYPAGCVAYTGTHDNDTIRGWFLSASGRPDGSGGARRRVERGRDGLTVAERAVRYVNGAARTIHWDMLRTLYQSPANLVVVPLQDALGLDNRARMNVPGTAEGNWGWRLRGGELSAGLARRLRELADTYERCPDAKLQRR